MRAIIETLCIVALAAYISALFIGAGVTAAGFYAGYEISE